VVSAYESGHRQPAIPTLAALIDTAGCELVISVRRQPRRLSRLSGPRRRRPRPDPAVTYRDQQLLADTAHEIIQATVDQDLPELERAIQAMTAALPGDPAS
jgi:hypothetical protein